LTAETDERRNRRASLAVVAAFAVTCAFCVNLFPRRPGGELAQSPNELSRYELVLSIVDRGSFSIGPELARFGDHEDKSVYRGTFYSNKAPGLSLAAVPAYAAIRTLGGAASPGDATGVFFLVRLFSVSLLCVVALAVFARRLERAGAGGWTAAILFAVAFGTPFLVYARSFFSHAWTASLLYLAFECLHRTREKAWHPALAGLLAGWAVLSEYPAAIVAAVLFLDAAWKRPPRRALAFVAGILPPAIALGLYDAACFSGPFDLSSAHEWYRPFSRLSGGRAFGFSLPSPWTALRFLFSPSRGVLFQSPFLLFLLPGLVERTRDRAVRVSLAAAGALFLAMCGYENWHGGWALGARYLLPAGLVAAWPLAFAARDSRRARLLFAAAAVFSAAFFLFSGSTWWFYPADPVNAPRVYTAWFLSHGWFVPTLAGSTFGGALVLAAATIVAGIAALRPLLRNREEIALGVFGGLAAFALIFAGSPPRASFGDRLTRVRMLESFTDLDPGRRELAGMRGEAETPADRLAWERTAAYYGLTR